MLNELFYKNLTLRNLIFLTAVILTTIFAYNNVDIFLVLFASVVIACSLNPFVDKLEKKNVNRGLASALVLALFILLILIVILPVLYMGLYEVGSFLESVRKYVSNIDTLIKSNNLLQAIGLTHDGIKAQLANFSQNIGDVFTGVIQFLQSLSSALVYMLISTIFIYFFMADKTTIKKGVLRLFPANNRHRTEEIFSIIGKKIGGYITAQAYAIASVGIVMTIGLLCFRVDYAILLGLITAALDIIPVIGPAIALVICLVATFEAGWIPVIGVVISFAAAQLIENNFVRPYAFSKLLNIHPVLVFIFLFIGAKYFGVVGALFAPAIAATVCVLVEELYIKSIE